MRISARGFFGGSTLYAHVVRRGKHGGRRAHMRIGRVKGDCMKVHARKRLFSAAPRPGRYLVQFDTFRRYKAARKVESEFIVTVFPKAGTARASSVRRQPGQLTRSANGPLPARRWTVSFTRSTRRWRHHSTPKAPPPRSRRPAAKSGISAWTS